ncbi:hypothetical protein MPH_00526 [Macrophomina phaseolina MS6]|uniref:Restriction of telomere capping protein 4 n=1 Tax=Macrophomina phaseolina (strain MS6) TaxID=1126212 RepID=K2S5K5_MACPH|nr:hypothetical protein MPH_00526 [Macrophomina phaseolina MS6]
MPSLSRQAEPLLKVVSGKSSTDHFNASSTTNFSSSPSSVPQAAPMPDNVAVDADPISSDSEHRSCPAPQPSPYKVPKGRTPIKGLRLGNGREKSKRLWTSGVAAAVDTQELGIGTSDSSVNVGDSEDMGLFGDMGGGPARKQRRTISYVASTRSFATEGARSPGSSGARSANSTPRRLHTLTRGSVGNGAPQARANSTGKEAAAAAAAATNKKGMPFSTISHNAGTPSLSSKRLPGKGGDGEAEGDKQTGNRRLKTLGQISCPSDSSEGKRGIKAPKPDYPASPREKPKLRLLRHADSSPRVREEDGPRIKKLASLSNSLPEEKVQKQIKVLPRMNLPPSPEDSTLGDTHEESQDRSVIDLSSATNNVRLSKRESGRAKAETVDTPSKAAPRKLKVLGSTGGPFSASKPRASDLHSVRRGKNQEGVEGEEEEAKAPALLPTVGCDDDYNNLSSPPDSDTVNDEEIELSQPPAAGNYEQPAKCPICRAPVDRLLLEEWQGGQSFMRIRKQMAFCEAHKRAAAREEYSARDYPAEINFKTLPQRIEVFREELVEIVRRERASAFRDAVEEEARKGQGRNLVALSKADEGLTGLSVGYYGPRGRRVMEAWVTREIATEIGQAVGRDRLIGFKSVSGFIQEVLVPEVAMRLVAEDLDVGAARAREVLRESGEIGEYVHGVEEEEEVEGGGRDGVEGEDDNGDY